LSDFVSLCKEDTVPQHLTPKAFGACGFTAVPVHPESHRDRSGVQKQSESVERERRFALSFLHSRSYSHFIFQKNGSADSLSSAQLAHPEFRDRGFFIDALF
jgi:hypothetical protein